MMNKKLLICGALATGLLLTACVKKEAPKEEEQTEVAASEATPVQQPALETQSADQDQPLIEEVPETVEVIREETPNTTTEIRRETRPAESNSAPAQAPSAPAQSTPAASQPAQAPKAKDTETEHKPKTNTGSAQSEDDAVADAIAAATPALDN